MSHRTRLSSLPAPRWPGAPVLPPATPDDDDLLGTNAADRIAGLHGDENLIGGDAEDTLSGGSGNDTLSGNAGDDLLSGGSGDDLLLPGSGRNRVQGGTGRDTLSFDDGGPAVLIDIAAQTATIEGRTGRFSGIEVFTGSAFRDTILGSAGDDVVLLSYGGDLIHGGSGNDLLEAAGPPFRFPDGSDFDPGQIFGGDGNDTLNGHSSNYTDESGVHYSEYPTELFGGKGNDRLNEAILLVGGAGRDTLEAGANGHSYGGAGQDLLLATYGDQTMHGGAGNDVLFVNGFLNERVTADLGGGDDLAELAMIAKASSIVDGGAGWDLLSIGPIGTIDVQVAALDMDVLNPDADGFLWFGATALTGFEQVSLFFSNGFTNGEFDGTRNTIRLGLADDIVGAGSGLDLLVGRGGDDTLSGYDGTDTIFGGEGNDVILMGTSAAAEHGYGGAGNDRLWGAFSMADDVSTAWLHGDAGQDLFCFAITPAQAAPDVIADFTPGQDRIGLAFSVYDVIDSAAPALADLPARVVVDSPDRLVFELSWLTTRPWGQEMLDYRITYDRGSGVLSAATLPGSSMQPVCRLRGAPDLTPEDFAVILETL